MSKLLTVEEEKTGLPIICLYGNSPTLQEKFVLENESKFRIIIIGETSPTYLADHPSIYFLTYKDSQLLPKLQETIDYAVCFIETEQSINNISFLMTKLLLDKTKVVFAVKVFSLVKSLETITAYRSTPGITFALLGEVMSLHSNEPGSLCKIIENAIVKKEITLQDNTTSVFAISATDSLHGISRLLFGNFKSNVFHSVFYNEPQTVLASAHLIARVEEVKIILSEEKRAPHSISRAEVREIITGRLRMEQRQLTNSVNGFEKEMQRLFELKPEEIEENVAPSQKKSKKKKTKSNFSRAFRFSLFSILLGVVLFAILNLLFFGLGVWFLNSSIKGLTNNSFKNVVSDSQKARFFLKTIEPTANFAFDVIDLSGASIQTRQGFALLERGMELSEIAGSAFNSFDRKERISSQSISSIMSDLSYLYREGQRIGIETKNETISKQLKHSYSKFLSFSEILPLILGFQEEKNYLLLFQNDEELRPTGGFIGSIGDLTMKDGEVKNLTIQDVYELDGQLRNHVEPHHIVRRHLQPHLYLRDSNFFLNFQEAASMSAYLYNLETGKKPDAVIAVNLEVLKRVVEIIGPIELPEYKVTVSSKNISEFIQSTIKKDFFPGSTQKKDILNKVLNQIVLKASTDPNIYIPILKQLPDLLEEKNILFAFSDNSIQKIFSANNYSGEPTDNRKSEPRKISDYLYINEANIGVNKVNKDIAREVNYQASVGQNLLTSKATLTLRNTSKTDRYTSYVTFVVPGGSKLKQLRINGVKQSVVPAVTDYREFEKPTFVKPLGLETEQFTRNNYMHIAFITTVEMEGENNIELDYDNGAVKNFATIAKYSLLYIKQPGTQPFNLTTTIDYPEGFAPVNTKADSYGKNFLKETATIKTDSLIEIELQKSAN